jgi:hypothetical protein
LQQFQTPNIIRYFLGNWSHLFLLGDDRQTFESKDSRMKTETGNERVKPSWQGTKWEYKYKIKPIDWSGWNFSKTKFRLA